MTVERTTRPRNLWLKADGERRMRENRTFGVARGEGGHQFRPSSPTRLYSVVIPFEPENTSFRTDDR